MIALFVTVKGPEILVIFCLIFLSKTRGNECRTFLRETGKYAGYFLFSFLIIYFIFILIFLLSIFLFYFSFLFFSLLSVWSSNHYFDASSVFILSYDHFRWFGHLHRRQASNKNFSELCHWVLHGPKGPFNPRNQPEYLDFGCKLSGTLSNLQ